MDKKLVVYTLAGTPISYIGELVSDTDTHISLSRVLVLYQQQSKTGSESISIGPVPYASRESKVTLSKAVTPGVMIEDIDQELKDHYGKEIFGSYSKLQIA